MATLSQLAGYDYRFEGGGEGPALLLLHGTGGNEHDLIPVGRLVAPKAPLLSPRGNVLENGAPRFFRRLAEGVFDMADLHARTAQLGEFLRQACNRHGIDTNDVVALGFSNGANVAASLMLSEPTLLRYGILLRAMVPFTPAPLPDLRASAALVTAGRTDRMIPPEQAELLAGLLRACGAKVELKWQDSGHSLHQSDINDARAFLKATLSV